MPYQYGRYGVRPMGLNLSMTSSSLNVANRMDAGLNHSPYVLVVERNRLGMPAHVSSVWRHGGVVAVSDTSWYTKHRELSGSWGRGAGCFCTEPSGAV